ncbi:MAG: ATP-binding protein [Oscillatoria sp. PMC 1068.18]|nr:ATP-binding protein [Oscillatoria sp. PMC 1076.18]MEC4989640.1 ATP-binding protein [Oscillatoria sp. PMC 1068.18]
MDNLSQKIIKVLLIEDDEDDYILIRDLLSEVREQKFVLDWVANYNQAVETVRQQEHDVYLVDYRLGEHNGLELLKLAVAENNQAPVIVLSGQGNRELDIAAIRAGAADYLDKAYLQSSLLEHYIRASIKRNQALKSLQETNTELQKLYERESQISQELALSNAELEEFAYVVSHDLQEPLRAIIGYTKLLETEYRDRFDETGFEYLDFVVGGARRMQFLIQDLLSYSRIATNGIEFAETDCNQILAQALDNLQVAITEIPVNIHSESLPQVMADPNQILQLFQNLLSNALKFRRQESLEIQINAELKDNQYWQFSVQDNGIGIKEKYFDRIFQVFKRLHTQREFPGTGIGLAVCKKIVERHGGKIWVESELGLGSIFYFTLMLEPQAKNFFCSLTLNEEER